MTKAVDGFASEGTIEQRERPSGDEEAISRLPPMRTPEEVAAKLAGITGALAFVASGSENDSGPHLWNALRFLSDELYDVNDVVAALLQARGKGA